MQKTNGKKWKQNIRKNVGKGDAAMEETSLRITGANKSFLNKITNTISKMLIPTKVGINGMLITVKRNSMIKAFERFNTEEENKELFEKKYDETYEAYLESLDKYVMDSIYKKVKNNTATDFEKNALSRYYSVVSLKETEYVEYKFRKQKFLIELDFQTVKINGKEKIIEKFTSFYLKKMDWLYKGILKNYSIKLADTTSKYDSSKELVYINIFNTLKEYIENILSIKLNQDENNVKKDYENYQGFEVGKLDQRDNIEKNMLLLGISRKLFTHSLPLTVAEQCYMKLLKDARCLVQDTKIAARREKAYNMLITLIEDYNIKLLSTKVYWENANQREEFKQFWNKYKDIQKLKDIDFIEYVKQKEILFIKDDIRKIKNEKFDYSKITKYYKRKLVDYGAMKEIQGYKSQGAFIKEKNNIKIGA